MAFGQKHAISIPDLNLVFPGQFFTALNIIFYNLHFKLSIISFVSRIVSKLSNGSINSDTSKYWGMFKKFILSILKAIEEAEKLAIIRYHGSIKLIFDDF